MPQYTQKWCLRGPLTNERIAESSGTVRGGRYARKRRSWRSCGIATDRGRDPTRTAEFCEPPSDAAMDSRVCSSVSSRPSSATYRRTRSSSGLCWISSHSTAYSQMRRACLAAGRPVLFGVCVMRQPQLAQALASRSYQKLDQQALQL